MKVVGIVAEYNPFHNGHAYQIQYIREVLGADYVIAVMSGDFVQRGTPAVFPKHMRAKMALENGVDLVLELPVRVATASAEGFASGAVKLLDQLGCVNHLCFGSECGDIKYFHKVTPVLCEEPKEYLSFLTDALKQGKTFPEARSMALQLYYASQNNHYNASKKSENNTFPLNNHSVNMQYDLISFSDSPLAEFLSSPNNILGIEYCKALYKLQSSIQPVTLKRSGLGFHDTNLNPGTLPSASGIRNAVSQFSERKYEKDRLQELLSSQLPTGTLEYIMDAICSGNYLTESDFDLLLHHRLLTSVYDHTLSDYQDVSASLAQRIENTLNQYTGYNPYTELLKTRDLTYTRIQRALLHILLGIKKETDSSASPVPYARILGFRKNASILLKEIKKNGQIPLLTKLANADKLLNSSAINILSENTYVSNLYELTLCHKIHSQFRHEYQKSPIVI